MTGLQKPNVQAATQAFIHQAIALIAAIEQAPSSEVAELNTLRAGTYLTQALTSGLIRKAQFDELTKAASRRLQEWTPSIDHKHPARVDSFPKSDRHQ